MPVGRELIQRVSLPTLMQSLPYMHIISNGERVDAFACPINAVSKLEQKLETHAMHLEPRLGFGRHWRRNRWRRLSFWKSVDPWKGATAGRQTREMARS